VVCAAGAMKAWQLTSLRKTLSKAYSDIETVSMVDILQETAADHSY